jgi:hypothetical protein
LTNNSIGDEGKEALKKRYPKTKIEF